MDIGHMGRMGPGYRFTPLLGANHGGARSHPSRAVGTQDSRRGAECPPQVRTWVRIFTRLQFPTETVIIPQKSMKLRKN